MPYPCDQCESLTINGIPTHEHGCPEAWRDTPKRCFQCGFDFTPQEYRAETLCPDCANPAPICDTCASPYDNPGPTCEDCLSADLGSIDREEASRHA